jgi:acetylornithine deacetylase/succinyl-diaminopimelate desuccinylase-like protein
MFLCAFSLADAAKEYGRLPFNVKLCVEGEEECASIALGQLLAEKKEALQADYTAVIDLGMHNRSTPAITLGIRGILALDLELEGTRTDLHSGSHGGLAYNPIHALTQLLSLARDSTGKITIPGFYDAVKPLPESQKAKLNLQFDAQEYEDSFGQPATGGEQALPPLERNWLRPTLEVNGIHGGYTGAGFKTVIPAKAYAKISCRLVPDQDPQKIGSLVANFFETHAPKGCKVTVHLHEGQGKPGRSNINSPIVKAYAAASQEVYGTPCAYLYSGASIPIATALSETAGSELLLVGLGLPDDAIHAPNEHFGLDRIQNGFLIISRLLQLLSTQL